MEIKKNEDDRLGEYKAVPKLLWRAFLAGNFFAMCAATLFYMHHENVLGVARGPTANVLGFLLLGASVFYLVRQDIVRFYSGDAKDASVRMILRFTSFGLGMVVGVVVLGFLVGFVSGLLT